jgi:CDP-6-deoxy-D-xylo-4-hexulose-3-dehydrase
VAQLKKLPTFIEKRKYHFAMLYDSLKKYDRFLLLPRATPRSEPSWFGFPIIVKDNAPFTRADIVRYLEDHKVATRMLFGGNLLKQPAYEGINYRLSGTLDNTDMVMNNLFWIGVYPGLTGEMLEYITAKFDAFFTIYPRGGTA